RPPAAPPPSASPASGSCSHPGPGRSGRHAWPGPRGRDDARGLAADRAASERRLGGPSTGASLLGAERDYVRLLEAVVLADESSRLPHFARQSSHDEQRLAVALEPAVLSIEGMNRRYDRAPGGKARVDQ